MFSVRLKRSLWPVYLLTGLLLLPALVPWLEIDAGTTQGELIYYAASSTGMLGLGSLVISLVLGVRWIARALSPDVEGVLAWHKWLGKIGVIFVVAHPLLTRLDYLEEWAWLWTLDWSGELAFHVSLGRIGILLWFVIWVSSAMLRSRLKYRPWLYLHYLSYPMVFVLLQHVEDIGSFTNSVLPLGVLAGVARGSLVIIILMRLLLWAGVGKFRYEVVGITEHGSDAVRIRLQAKNKNLKIEVGQYTYLQWRRWGEARPYSVLRIHERELEFAVGTVGAFSRRVKDLEVGQTVYLDGGYGVFLREENDAAPRMYYAGGVGITPFVESVLERENKTALFYSVWHTAELLGVDEMSDRLGKDLHIHVTREATSEFTNGRVTAAEVHKTLTKFGAETEHYICGSGGFTEAMQGILGELGVPANQIHTEAFSH